MQARQTEDLISQFKQMTEQLEERLQKIENRQPSVSSNDASRPMAYHRKGSLMSNQPATNPPLLPNSAHDSPNGATQGRNV